MSDTWNCRYFPGCNTLIGFSENFQENQEEQTFETYNQVKTIFITKIQFVARKAFKSGIIFNAFRIKNFMQ